VIVDEVQDLTCVGLQLLHALVGDRPDGLLIVGDGQQSVYPGGFTLAEAGVSVVGRSTVLQRNYRNCEDILQYALAVVMNDEFDDLDSDPQLGLRDVQAHRPGGYLTQVTVADQRSQEHALCAHLLDLHAEAGVRFGDMAVLAPRNATVGTWRRVLVEQGIPAMLLRDYDGTPTDAVKVGTVHRAKGLDFAHVSIPDRNHLPGPQGPGESDEAYRERAELERRQLYVAITRARDSLWVGLREAPR
jgi:superfamily I DNA/RNA helicase